VVSGCIRIGRFTWEERLQRVFNDITRIIIDYAPQGVAIERIFVHKNVASALKLGQIRGALMVAVALQGLKISEYTPRQVKKTVVGYGAAEKVQVQHMMRTILKLDGLPQSDAADALAIAMCHGQMSLGMLR
jgi:crossover junction endodeoxyribonuclease RuvC